MYLEINNNQDSNINLSISDKPPKKIMRELVKGLH